MSKTTKRYNRHDDDERLKDSKRKFSLREDRRNIKKTLEEVAAILNEQSSEKKEDD